MKPIVSTRMNRSSAQERQTVESRPPEKRTSAVSRATSMTWESMRTMDPLQWVFEYAFYATSRVISTLHQACSSQLILRRRVPLERDRQRPAARLLARLAKPSPSIPRASAVAPEPGGLARRASPVRTARHFRCAMRPRGHGSRWRAGGLSARAEFLRRAQLQPLHELRPRHRAPGDRIMGGGPFAKAFPGGEHPHPGRDPGDPAKPHSRRLRHRGHRWAGRPATLAAVRDFQRKAGIQPADGYPGLKAFARLRK